MTADLLRDALAGLPVRIDAIESATAGVDVPSYGGVRPATTVIVHGAGATGRGEFVGWTDAAHVAVARSIATLGLVRSWRIAELASCLAETLAAEPYLRAAVEAAAIDLALRQAGTTLLALAGVDPRPVRFVVSFGRVADPAAEARRHGNVDLKVDVDPAWPEPVWRALAATGRVAVLDWKGAGDDVAYARAACMPNVLHEDPRPPLPPDVRARRSLDAALVDPSLIDTEGDVLTACNLKPPRMGGVLAVLDAAAGARRRGIPTYMGGMFEVGVGRTQLLALATVLSPDGPNDIAPIPLVAGFVTHPNRLIVDPTTPGFGGAA